MSLRFPFALSLLLACAAALAGPREDVVAVSGKWQSERTAEGRMVTAGPSRVTVVLQKREGRWLIVQFHNSPTPKAAP